MKITQEVRDFAAKQSSPLQGRGPSALVGPCRPCRAESVDPNVAVEDAERGLVQMSERFPEEGGENLSPRQVGGSTRLRLRLVMLVASVSRSHTALRSTQSDPCSQIPSFE